MDESVLDLVRAHMREARAPARGDRVYKDECQFCFATTLTPGGLYLNLSTHQAFDEDHVDLDQERTGAVLYLHTQAHRVRWVCVAGMVGGGIPHQPRSHTYLHLLLAVPTLHVDLLAPPAYSGR